MKDTACGPGDQVTSDLGPFSLIPEWVLDANVSHVAVRLYCVLARYADNGTGSCFPNRRTLWTRLGCSKRSLDGAVKELENIGALVHERRDGTSNLWTVRRVPFGMGSKLHHPRAEIAPPRGRNSTTELEPLDIDPLDERENGSHSEIAVVGDKTPAENLLDEFKSRGGHLTTLNECVALIAACEDKFGPRAAEFIQERLKKGDNYPTQVRDALKATTGGKTLGALFQYAQQHESAQPPAMTVVSCENDCDIDGWLKPDDGGPVVRCAVHQHGRRVAV